MLATPEAPMAGLLVMPPNLDTASPATTHAPPWAALLEPCYRRLGLTLPPTVKLPPDAVPGPYHQLLVHSDDMTPTLEKFHRDRLHLRPLSREYSANSYRREVVLELERRGQPVEYGVIGIRLQHLPPAARRLVLEEQCPFGRILQTEAIPHLSWPQAFFSVRSDAYLSRLLGSRPGSVLYGRRNVLVDGRRRLLADVIEIVAAAPEPTPLSP